MSRITARYPNGTAYVRICPTLEEVILKAHPPRTYGDAKYRVKEIVMRKLEGKLQPVAVLEDFNGRSLVYADTRHIVEEEQSA